MKIIKHIILMLVFLTVLTGVNAQVKTLTDYLRFVSPWDTHPIVRLGSELSGLITFPYISWYFSSAPVFSDPNYPVEEGAFRGGLEFKNIGGLFDSSFIDGDLSFQYLTFDLDEMVNGFPVINHGIHLTGSITWASFLETAFEWETFNTYNFLNFQLNIVDFSWLPGENLSLGYQPKSMRLYNFIRLEGGEINTFSQMIKTGFPFIPYLSVDYSNPPDVWIFSPQARIFTFWFRPILMTRNDPWSGFEATLDLAIFFDPDYESYQPENLYKISSEDVNAGKVTRWLFGLTVRDQVIDPFTGLPDPYSRISLSQYGFDFFGPFVVISLEEGLHFNRSFGQIFQGDFNAWSIYLKADFKMAFSLK
ncbi:MAG: hypothetical protein JW969_02840 [Spirochaetales bacterium]|nr:hypothetical protein [Spirochaetales bacterium]